ncbi:hypothetical protein CFP56_027230 [Quercus suber]|uniref:Uncharacterized protein n=1 Tax=Quercus suber TaxID=58331 RepID=A0AAW0JXP4_QUESU
MALEGLRTSPHLALAKVLALLVDALDLCLILFPNCERLYGLHTSQSQQVRRETKEMAGGTFATQGRDPRHAEDGAITGSVVIICIVAASAGLIFGYDL